MIITVVDLSLSPRETLPFAPETLTCIERSLASGRHVIIYHNRRWAGTATICRTCSHVWQCPRCDVALVRHLRPTDRLRCHRCGYVGHPPETCPECGGADIATIGVGTQAIESRLQTLFPSFRIVRLDADSGESAWCDDPLLSPSIFVGTASVLSVYSDRIGTCVFTLFENDSIVTSYDSDETLHRRIRLLSERSSETVIQTHIPHHPVIRSFVSGTYREFARESLDRRMRFWYPPYAELVDIVIRHRDRTKLDTILASIESWLTNRQNTTELSCDRSVTSREDGLYVRRVTMKWIDLGTDLALIRNTLWKNRAVSVEWH